MNFVILGAGAIGCYIGGRLAAGGRHVTLVGRPRTVDALAASGLVVTDLDGFRAYVDAHRLNLVTSLASVRMNAPSVVLLCVKGGATEAAALQIAAFCPGGTTVISLQNGVDNVARITAIAPSMLAMAGMVPYNVVMPTPGHVHRATSGKLHIGSSALTHEMALLLNACGLTTRLAIDMRPLQWGKLLINLNNPVNALSDLPLRAQLMDRDYRRVLAGLQHEALAVMKRAGIQPAKVAAAPPRALPHILRMPNWLFRLAAARMLRIDDAARSSMWDDVQQGRTTEVDDLCGAVVRLAAQHGMQAPRNLAMCKLVAAHRKGVRLSGPEMRKTALP
jgi:2-dehydropantoate 2-reductase